MLNLSLNNIRTKIEQGRYETFSSVLKFRTKKVIAAWMLTFMAIGIVILFLPWTQNIQAKGKITTINPAHRPQTIHATIAGRIETWYVREGQVVKKGDTIAFLSEVKSEYFDPNLIERQGEQVDAKRATIGSYESKMNALTRQVDALRQNRTLKIEQAKNKLRQAQLKITSDSIELKAALADKDIAIKQLDRAKEMYAKGVTALTELEKRQMKVQETVAKAISAENKYLVSQNELLNARIELNNIQAEYEEKIAKSESDRFSTQSEWYDAQGNVAKMENQYANYQLRAGFYYIIAPQDGFISEVLTPGIGETVKEGEPIVSIMPSQVDLAVELYVRPIDLPLLSIGEKVRFIFDGWPAFVFSGWPGQSFGTYGGLVLAIDQMANKQNTFRVLVKPDPNDKPWPTALRVGSGAQGVILLKDVPVWYELWRQLNGFPPDFYQEEVNDENLKLKAPIKSLK